MTERRGLDRGSYRGIFVIVATPFDAALDLDEASLRATMRFCAAAGVQGVVATANAGEVGYLAEDERRRVAEIVIEEAAGRVPVVVGVSASCARLAAMFARHAERAGADAVMAMPPTLHPARPEEIRDFYRALGAATDLPLVIQNMSGPGGTAMGPALMAEILREVPTARFVKEETNYEAITASEVMALAGEALHGVMGGKAGKTFMGEHARGVAGTMPACEIADVHVALWHALEAGERARAWEIFGRLLPLLDMESIYGPALYKEVLRRRGVIAHAARRQTGARELDAAAHDELGEILRGLEPYMLDDYRVRA